MATYQILSINLFSSYIFILKVWWINVLKTNKQTKNSESTHSISPSNVDFECVVKGI